MPIDHVTALEQEAAALVASARDGKFDAPVPSCPGWDRLRLFRHLGMVHRSVTVTVETGEQADRAALGSAPKDGDLIADWLEEGVAALADALRRTDPAKPAWNPFGIEPVVASWRRRMAHETAVHRWDAQQAIGEPTPVDAALASDGVDEFLTGFLPRDVRERGAALPSGTLHLHATDAEGEWTLRAGPAGPEVDRGHAKGDAAVRGTASDLLLLVWHRLPREGGPFEVFGDTDVADAWLALAHP